MFWVSVCECQKNTPTAIVDIGSVEFSYLGEKKKIKQVQKKTLKENEKSASSVSTAKCGSLTKWSGTYAIESDARSFAKRWQCQHEFKFGLGVGQTIQSFIWQYFADVFYVFSKFIAKIAFIAGKEALADWAENVCIPNSIDDNIISIIIVFICSRILYRLNTNMHFLTSRLEFQVNE